MSNKLFVLGMVLLLLVGCATEKSSWEKSKKENTIAAYKNFREKYHESPFSREAMTRIIF